MADAPAEFAAGGQNFLTSGNRAITIMPMTRGDEAIGLLSVVRLVPGPLSDEQLAVLRTFANQAVIAIENTRLLNELRARISLPAADRHRRGSQGHQPLSPDLDKVLDASRECDRACATPMTLRSSRCLAMVCASSRTMGSSHRGPVGQLTIPVERAPWQRVLQSTDGPFRSRTCWPKGMNTPRAGRGALQNGHRTALAVPLLKRAKRSGFILMRRGEVRPFAESQVELITTFADQAVIAIENTRLFEAEQASKRDLQQSLEYQTAISKVLSVISHSPNELQPVLDAIVTTARTLCQAENAFVMRLDPSDGKFHVAAASSDFPEMIAYVKSNPAPPGRASISGRVAIEHRAVHVVDTLNDPEMTYADLGATSTRTRLGVPLLKDGAVVGVIVLNRRAMVPFGERQIGLITSFADQAVIAIENTRLFEEVQARTRELTESLEYQTATSEVLNVISRSPSGCNPS